MDTLPIAVMTISASRSDAVPTRWAHEGEGTVISSDVVGCPESKYYFIFELLESIELISN